MTGTGTEQERERDREIDREIDRERESRERERERESDWRKERNFHKTKRLHTKNSLNFMQTYDYL